MSSGIVRQINGEIAQSKTKGKQFSKELGAAFAQEKIAKTLPKTQDCKSYKK